MIATALGGTARASNWSSPGPRERSPDGDAQRRADWDGDPVRRQTGTPRHLGVNRIPSEPDAVQAVPAPGRRSLPDSGAEARVKRPNPLQLAGFPGAPPTEAAA